MRSVARRRLRPQIGLGVSEHKSNKTQKRDHTACTLFVRGRHVLLPSWTRTTPMLPMSLCVRLDFTYSCAARRDHTSAALDNPCCRSVSHH